MSLDEEFSAAAEAVKGWQTPPDAEMLEMYSLYKQATVGDVNTPEPGLTEVRAAAKWRAWTQRRGMSPQVAKQQYVALAEQYGPRFAK